MQHVLPNRERQICLCEQYTYQLTCCNHMMAVIFNFLAVLSDYASFSDNWNAWLRLNNRLFTACNLEAAHDFI